MNIIFYPKEYTIKIKLKPLKQILDENECTNNQNCYWFKDKHMPGIVEDMVDKFGKSIDVIHKDKIIEYYEDIDGFTYHPKWFEG